VLTIDVESRSDVMNDYYDANKESKVEPTFTDTSAIRIRSYDHNTKTPLQRVVSHVQRDSQAAASSSSQMEVSNGSHKGLSLIVQRQKEMTDRMIMQQNHSLLPKREVTFWAVKSLSLRQPMW